MTSSGIAKAGRASRRDDLARVEREMRERVASGAWPVGAIVSSRRDLAFEFGVDLNTIQRAMAPLLSDGTLRAENGRGTFVGVARAMSVSGQNGAAAPQRICHIGTTAYYDEVEAAQGTDLLATMAVVASIENRTRALGLQWTFLNRWRRGEKELSPAAAARDLLAQGVDAVMVVDPYTHPYVVSEMRSATDLADRPVVYVSTVGVYVPCAHVFYDNRDAGFRAAERLCAEGYREISFLGPYIGDWSSMRADGAKIACDTLGVSYRATPPEERFEYFDAETYARTEAFLERLLDSGAIRGGIIAEHDALAFRLMDRAADRGLTVGMDYGLIGFDDVPRALVRGLTTVRPPLEEMAAEAVRLNLAWSPEARMGIVVSLRAPIVERRTHWNGEKL